MNNFLPLFAMYLATALGLIFLVAAGRDKKQNEFIVDEPASPAAVDHKKIMDSIASCTENEHIRKAHIAAEKFFDLHYHKVNREILKGYYTSLLEAIAKRQKEIYGEPVPIS